MREFRFDGPNFNYRFDNRDRDNREPRRFEYRLPGGVMPFIAGSRGRLGVTVQSLTPDLAEYFGAKNGGALVSSVTKESAAAKAGVKAGDVITSINGKRVEDSDDLLREMGDAKGETTIVLLRDKKEVTLKVVIDDKPKGLSPQERVLSPQERGLPQPVRPRSRPGVL
jgi:membrane-associated protease RseP (regulator of RpoE activity)